MCGIVSLVYHDENPDMGKEAADLLRRLEYRGYDSTGASFIDRAGAISLVKKVGAPSKVCRELGVEKHRGQRFIGQVRWATYGAVTDINSQPHRVACKVGMVGAHNGNISNTDSLKTWLTERGHAVVSDNDGEIVVHLVEEFLDANRAAPAPVNDGMKRAWVASELGLEAPSDEVLLMIDALRKADSLAEGSYAAAVSDPRVPGVFVMKSGSSLYAGHGRDLHGDFVVVSSDLTSVLSKTKALIPLAEGEGLWFTETGWLAFSLGGEVRFSRPATKRSKLDVKDTALDPKFRHYMEQEILGSGDNIDRVVRYYFRDPSVADLDLVLEAARPAAEEIAEAAVRLADLEGDAATRDAAEKLFTDQAWTALSARASTASKPSMAAPPDGSEPLAETHRGGLVSDEKELLADIGGLCPQRERELALLDALFVWRKRSAVLRDLASLVAAIKAADAAGGRLFLVASGTSYHAALTAAYFFDKLAGIAIHPCNPGQFRSMYFSSLDDRDFIFGITQSGETKDLVDIFQDAKAKAPGLRRACLVNNENSRIPQELSDFFLPILCGPEIAVAATKSFTNQLAILYLVAASFSLPEIEVVARLRRARSLVDETISTCRPALEETAAKLALRPSLHILGTGLIGLAKEGALKIREVVLNHAEGYDAAEFKHGPNTILGKNTIFSVDDIARAIALYREALATEPGLAKLSPEEALAHSPAVLEGLFRDYPLVFVCPPDERDVRITVSQIHTHKIRGADIVLIAERDPSLSLAVEGRPTGIEAYWSKYIELPATGDPCLFVFAAAAALQLLAYRMSVTKMEYLDALRVADHGVHPDAPKNVSKSITVD
ncbi:MAG TPA: SIS domain-containing protein [Rectinemataceae bacterium]|nr:SIS domain-containing protein [Rectinemataceae bacterium]